MRSPGCRSRIRRPPGRGGIGFALRDSQVVDNAAIRIRKKWHSSIVGHAGRMGLLRSDGSVGRNLRPLVSLQPGVLESPRIELGRLLQIPKSADEECSPGSAGFVWFGSHALRFGSHALRFRCHALRFRCHALRFRCYALRFGCYALRFRSHALRFGSHALRFGNSVVWDRRFLWPKSHDFSPAHQFCGTVSEVRDTLSDELMIGSPAEWADESMPRSQPVATLLFVIFKRGPPQNLAA